MVWRRSMKLPQMPCVAVSLTVKHRPRHWMFCGVVEPGTVVVTVGLHGAPSGRRAATNAEVPQSPVRVLQTEPVAQCALVVQKGVHPVVSGVPDAWVNHQPVHTKPARHAPVAVVVPAGRQVLVQSELSSGASPCVRQVDPAPPHIDCSTACEALFEHVSVQNGTDPDE